MVKFIPWILLALVSSYAYSLEHADEAAVLRCAALQASSDRLECFDTFVQGILDRQAVSREAATRSVPVIVPVAVTPNMDDDFGNKPENKSEKDQIRTTISNVTKSAMGNRVMTLANGQVWMEDEAGRRRIEPDDEIIITQRRFRYAMKFASGPVIAVHRVD